MRGETHLTNTEKNSFTPIPMIPSGDDIDDMHHMTLQPNLSWSLIGETSPLQKFYSGKLMVIVVFSKDNSQTERILLKWWQYGAIDF